MLKEVKIEKENKKMMAATLVVIRLRRRCILSEKIFSLSESRSLFY